MSASKTVTALIPLSLPSSTTEPTSARSRSLSPIRSQKFQVMPSTPDSKKIRTAEQTEEIFCKPITNATAISSEFDALLKEQAIFNTRTYHLSGRTLAIIQQTGKRTSGAASMMIALDILLKRKKCPIEEKVGAKRKREPSKSTPQTSKKLFTDDFFHWFHESTLTRGQDLVSNLEKEGFHPSLVSFLKENSSPIEPTPDETVIFFKNRIDILQSISRTINQTKNSVIISMNHSKIGSHWIIIDKIEVGIHKKIIGVFVRDPFTGKAYFVTPIDLINNFDDSNVKIEAIYLKD